MVENNYSQYNELFTELWGSDFVEQPEYREFIARIASGRTLPLEINDLRDQLQYRKKKAQDAVGVGVVSRSRHVGWGSR